MIQRIQSVYLLLVVVLLVICVCNPVGNVIASDSSISEFGNLYISLPDGNMDYAPWALFVILLISALLSLGTIFLFKKRMLQIRLLIFNIVLLFGYYVVLVFLVFAALTENTSFSASWTVCLPFISIILNWLAIRAIGKDEVLVKAYERLR